MLPLSIRQLYTTDMKPFANLKIEIAVVLISNEDNKPKYNNLRDKSNNTDANTLTSQTYHKHTIS